jgi:D-glycero-alpha-D-manno-heptose 1-phosphate guanylyltransferase
MKTFEAIILAGGKGTRLKSVTGDLPKPMVDVNNTPFLYSLMQRLEVQGCKKIVLSLCYRAEYIIERVMAERPVQCHVEFVTEKEPLGTGGAVKLAADYISEEKFLVLNGDTFSDINYQDLLENSKGVDLLVSGVFVSDVSRYGTLDLGLNNVVKSLCEKGGSGEGVINSGTYVASKANIEAIKQVEFSFEEYYIKNFKGVVKAFISDGYFIDIGIPEDYFLACCKLK